MADLTEVPDGLRILIRRSKGDESSGQHHRIDGKSSLSYAREIAWREDPRGQSKESLAADPTASAWRPSVKGVPESSASAIDRSKADKTSAMIVGRASCSSRISPGERFRDSRPKTRAASPLTAS